MEWKIETRHILFIVLGVLSLILDFYFFYSPPSRWFKPLIVISILIAGINFLMDYINENNRQKEIEVKFLEFVRALVQTTKSGISIPKGIVQISHEDYGPLNPYVKKLAYDIEWGYSLHEALNIFSKRTNNTVIKKSISIVTEAEKSGGNMADVLQAVTDSVYSIKKIKEERRTAVYSQMVQGYIIYFVFIIIMLVMQVYLLPKISTLSSDIATGLSGTQISGFTGAASTQVSSEQLDQIFIWLIIIQGLFAGLMIGKFTEGELKYGIQHAVILMVLGYLIITTVKGI